MKAPLAVTVAMVVGTACATTYNLPPEERSRSFEEPREVVWDAALDALDELGIAIVLAEEEHGRILGRTKGSIWDLKGHVVQIVLTDSGRGRTRLEANAETSSDDSVIDFGRSRGIVRDFLDAVEARLTPVSGTTSTG
jgi:hypothetical protein